MDSEDVLQEDFEANNELGTSMLSYDQKINELDELRAFLIKIASKMFEFAPDISIADLTEYKTSIVKFIKEYNEQTFIEDSAEVLHRALAATKLFVNFKDREAFIDAALERLNLTKAAAEDRKVENLSKNLQQLFVDFVL